MTMGGGEWKDIYQVSSFCYLGCSKEREWKQNKREKKRMYQIVQKVKIWDKNIEDVFVFECCFNIMFYSLKKYG